jgi:hypothetical protein
MGEREERNRKMDYVKRRKWGLDGWMDGWTDGVQWPINSRQCQKHGKRGEWGEMIGIENNQDHEETV